MNIKLKKSNIDANTKSKSLVYYSKYIEIFLNEKHNWCSPGTTKKYEKENKFYFNCSINNNFVLFVICVGFCSNNRSNKDRII